MSLSAVFSPFLPRTVSERYSGRLAEKRKFRACHGMDGLDMGVAA